MHCLLARFAHRAGVLIILQSNDRLANRMATCPFPALPCAPSPHTTPHSCALPPTPHQPAPRTHNSQVIVKPLPSRTTPPPFLLYRQAPAFPLYATAPNACTTP